MLGGGGVCWGGGGGKLALLEPDPRFLLWSAVF